MMNKAAPWSIKGIGFDTREAAREAAQREGMSVGEWLNEVIAERAGDDEAEKDYRDDDEMGAVSARLSRMRDNGRARRRGEKHGRGHDDDGVEDFAAHRRRGAGRNLSRNASAREVSWRDSEEAENLIESALEAYERRAARGQDKTARALAEMVDVIESSQVDRSREGRTLQSISRRLAEIEQKVTRDGDEAGAKPIRGALSRLESRVDDLAQDKDARRGDNGLREIDSKLSEIATYLESGERGRADADRLARIEAQLSQLSTQMAQGAARQTIRAVAAEASTARPQAADAVSQIMRRQRELDGEAPLPFAARRAEPRPPFDQRRAPSELETRLASVVERLERAIPAEGAAQPQALVGLQGDINRMSERIEKMREEFASRGARGADETIDHLRREVAAVSRGLGELAPRASVSSLETAVRDIADRLHVARIEGVRDAVAAPIEQLARELRAGLRDMDSREAIGGLEQDMRAIAAKIENLEMRGGADPQTIRAIFDQTREVRDLLSRAAVASHSGERAQRELDDLASKLERSGGAGVAPDDIARIVSDIRSVVAEGMGAEGMRALEARVERLSERIDAALAAGPAQEQMEVFGDRLDKLHRAVAQSLAAPRHAPAAETQNLEKLVRELADKVDRAAGPGAGREDLAALQTQIELLSRKIERSGGRDESVASLERMISDLFGQLNDTRAAAFEAAEEAARAAARESVREALAGAGGASSGEIGREIADLRAVQDASDQRTHATLKAVHATLERVVDRLATLEGDIGETRAAPRPAVPPPPAMAPAPEATPAQGSTISAAAALARLKGEKAEPRVEARPQRPAPSLDQDILIEPGAGRATRPAAPGDADDRSPQAGFIAAARRAALAAQAASAAADEAEAVDHAEKAEGEGRLSQVRAVYERRRKPILLSLAALIGLLGALQIARVYTSRSSGLAEPPPIVRPADPAPAVKAPAQEEPAANKGAAVQKDEGAAPVGPKAEASPPADAAPAAAPAPRRVDAPSSLPTMARQPRADAGAVDSAPVGSIQSPANVAIPTAALEKIATQGDAAAQFELAARYADGAQAPRDLKAAARWFEKSAAKGLAPAQYRLGVLFERGLGVERDLAVARTWYERAAETGNVRAMHNLAVLLADGGGKPDYAAAARWFRKAAEYGVRDSQYNLAILYARGMGGPQDLVQSYAWFAAAADQGDADAAKKRDDVASRFDAKTMERAKALAGSYRPKAPEPAANDVTPPPGGWQAAPAKGNGKAARPTISRL
jgi:localization factor PodJL